MKKILFFFFLPAICFSQNTPVDKINVAADKIETKSVLWRRDIHQNPELGNNEKKTAKIIC